MLCRQPSPSLGGAWGGGGFRGALSCGGENQDPHQQQHHHHQQHTNTAAAATAVSSPQQQQQHQQQTTTQFQFHVCGHCFKRCKSAELLRQHEAQARHSPHDPRCGACGKHFANLDTLRQHLDGQLPSKKCKARYQKSGCPRCLAISPEGSPPHHLQRCPFEIIRDATTTTTTTTTTEEEPTPTRVVGGGSSSADDAASTSTPSTTAATTMTMMNTSTTTTTTTGAGAGAAARRGGFTHRAAAAVALDCEMVGTEEDGSGAMCARVCVVDECGEVLLSTYVAPTAPITDYRTAITGITAESLEGAPSLADVRARVLYIFGGGGGGGGGGKVLLVGHDLPHDLDCLDIQHPEALCRDTAHYPLFQRHTHHPYKLRQLAATLLDTTIQAEGAAHDPKEDAVAAMRLYVGGRALCDAHHPDGVVGGGGENNVIKSGGVVVVGGGISSSAPSPPPRAMPTHPVSGASAGGAARSPLREETSSSSQGAGAGVGAVAFAAAGVGGGGGDCGSPQRSVGHHQRQYRQRGGALGGSGGSLAAAGQGLVVEPRFRCWCGDRVAAKAASQAWGGVGSPARAKSMTAGAHGATSPSPLKVLKDATNTKGGSSGGN